MDQQPDLVRVSVEPVHHDVRPISGAILSSYVPVSLDVGDTLTVSVTRRTPEVRASRPPVPPPRR